MSDDDIFNNYDSSTTSPYDDEPVTSPSAEQNATKKLAQNHQYYGLKFELPIVTHVVHFTFRAAASLRRTEQLNTPAARALYDFVNEGTEGEVDARLRLYEIESRVVLLHDQKRFINSINEALERVGRERSESTARFAMYIDCWVDYVDFALAANIEQYVQFAEAHGLRTLPTVIESGMYPYVTPSLALLGGNPPGKNHYLHGDVSQLQSRNHALIALWISYGLDIAAEKESVAFEDIFA